MLPRLLRAAIVLLLIAIILLLVTEAAALEAQQPSAQSPDLILVGGRIFTADPARPWAEALSIRGERILAVGSIARIARSAGPGTRRIDLEGRLPGFNDAHAHLGCQRPDAAPDALPAAVVPAHVSDDPFPDPAFGVVADSLRSLALRMPGGTWIGASIGDRVLEDSTARRAALDRVAPNHPVWLGAWTGHGAVLNTPALRALGIDDTTADPLGGRYEREPGSRRVTGLLEEYAGFQAKRRLCSMQPETVLVAALRAIGRQFPRFGITSVQNIGNELEPALLMRVVRAANLPVRLRMIPFPMTSPLGRADAAEWQAERVTGLDPQLRRRNAHGLGREVAARRDAHRAAGHAPARVS